MTDTRKNIANLVTKLKSLDFLHKDNLVTTWSSTTSDDNVPSEKLVKTELDGKAPKNHSTSLKTYGLGNTLVYGHVKLVNNLNQSSNVEGLALSAYQGKVLNDRIGEAITYINQ